MPALRSLLATIGLLGASALAGAQDGTMTEAEIQSLIWEREMAIFEGRSAGNIAPYLNATSSVYLGWPPNFAAPLPLGDFKAGADMAKGLKGEETQVEKMGFTLNGNTALTYFKTHRTRLGEGMAEESARAVNQFYENIHVWTLENGDWRLIGGMARPVAAPEEAGTAP